MGTHDDDDSGRSHCGECGGRFMGEELAEVVLKDPNTGEAVGPHIIIHADCFEEDLHEVA